LFRLPLLLKHFREHQKQEPAIGFLEFLVLHYAAGHGKTKDHAKLPFHDYSHSSVAVVYAPMIETISSARLHFMPDDLHGSFHEERLFTTFSDRILQPPRC
jgi:hypothetical protein